MAIVDLKSARANRAAELHAEAKLYFREADELRRLANEADAQGMEAELRACELDDA